jgi:hypothetical protein
VVVADVVAAARDEDVLVAKLVADKLSIKRVTVLVAADALPDDATLVNVAISAVDDDIVSLSGVAAVSVDVLELAEVVEALVNGGVVVAGCELIGGVSVADVDVAFVIVEVDDVRMGDDVAVSVVEVDVVVTTGAVDVASVSAAAEWILIRLAAKMMITRTLAAENAMVLVFIPSWYYL